MKLGSKVNFFLFLFLMLFETVEASIADSIKMTIHINPKHKLVAIYRYPKKKNYLLLYKIRNNKTLQKEITDSFFFYVSKEGEGIFSFWIYSKNKYAIKGQWTHIITKYKHREGKHLIMIFKEEEKMYGTLWIDDSPLQ